MNTTLTPLGNPGALTIEYLGEEIGQLLYSNEFKDDVKMSVKTHDEFEFLANYESKDDIAIVNSISFYGTVESVTERDKVRKELLESFELLCKEKGYKRVLLLVNHKQMNDLIKLGYNLQGGLSSTRQSILTKSI